MWAGYLGPNNTGSTPWADQVHRLGDYRIVSYISPIDSLNCQIARVNMGVLMVRE